HGDAVLHRGEVHHVDRLGLPFGHGRDASAAGRCWRAGDWASREAECWTFLAEVEENGPSVPECRLAMSISCQFTSVEILNWLLLVKYPRRACQSVDHVWSGSRNFIVYLCARCQMTLTPFCSGLLDIHCQNVTDIVVKGLTISVVILTLMLTYLSVVCIWRLSQLRIRNSIAQILDLEGKPLM